MCGIVNTHNSDHQKRDGRLCIMVYFTACEMSMRALEIANNSHQCPFCDLMHVSSPTFHSYILHMPFQSLAILISRRWPGKGRVETDSLLFQ